MSPSRADGRRVYVCIRGKSQVDIIDTDTLTKSKSVEVGKGPHNVYRTPDGSHIATAMEGEKTDGDRCENGRTVVHHRTRRRAASRDYRRKSDKTIRRLFVQLSNLHGFEVIDWASRKVTATIELPKAPPEARP